MRIHEVLDACIEYVAYEGVLGKFIDNRALVEGSSPAVVRQKHARLERSVEVVQSRQNLG
jgi:hypothetical protein